MLQSTRTIEEPPMAMVQSALEVGRLLWLRCRLSVSGRGVFLHLNARNHSKSVLALRELDTVKYQVPEPQIWTSLQLYRLRMAESSHSLVIGHSPDLQPLPCEMAINEKLPTAKHISKLKEEIISQWFR